jgi:hypothetical protein
MFGQGYRGAGTPAQLGDETWYSHFEKQLDSFLKSKTNQIISSFSLSSIFI